jgi:hypothetical protein
MRLSEDGTDGSRRRRGDPREPGARTGAVTMSDEPDTVAVEDGRGSRGLAPVPSRRQRRRCRGSRPSRNTSTASMVGAVGRYAHPPTDWSTRSTRSAASSSASTPGGRSRRVWSRPEASGRRSLHRSVSVPGSACDQFDDQADRPTVSGEPGRSIRNGVAVESDGSVLDSLRTVGGAVATLAGRGVAREAGAAGGLQKQETVAGLDVLGETALRHRRRKLGRYASPSPGARRTRVRPHGDQSRSRQPVASVSASASVRYGCCR